MNFNVILFDTYFMEEWGKLWKPYEDISCLSTDTYWLNVTLGYPGSSLAAFSNRCSIAPSSVVHLPTT